MMAAPAILAPDTAPMGVTRTAVVRRVVRETPDTSTYWLTLLDPEARASYRFLPGQFNMVYLFGIGEVPISISSDPFRPDRLAHTVRATGRVTNAFPALRPGHQVGLRGPFGRPWPVDVAKGGDLVIVAGGLGLAPVRPSIYDAIHSRDAYDRVLVLVGSRGPEHLLFRDELDAWAQWMRGRGIEVGLTCDVADDGWPYGTGVVTTLFPAAGIRPERTTAFVCGPEIMMRFAARDLLALGLPPERLYLSMERNMQCAVQLCGHCQLGPKFVCADGPVFRHDEIADLLEVREL
jgi:NAD(P)H-flavin reductase